MPNDPPAAADPTAIPAIQAPADLADPRAVTVPNRPGERDYFPELDGLRFFAFALVYLFHRGVPQWSGWIRGIMGAILPGDQPPLGPPGDLGARLQDNGWVGVQIFFVLSGFLITTLLLREERRYGRIDLRSFWVRRILRIWPLYYLVLAIAVGLMPLIDGVLTTPGHLAFLRRQIAAFLAFLGNWSMGWIGPPPNDAISVLWSVCVEEQFYILCPLLLAFLPRGFRVGVLVALVGLAIGSRAWLARQDTNPLFFQYSTVTHFDSLMSGVLLAFLLVKFGNAVWLRRLAGWMTLPILFALGWLLTREGLARGNPTRLTWDYVAIWLATCGLITVLVVRQGLLNAVLGYERFVWLGKISYGLYMYHEITLWLTRRWFDRMGWFPNKEILQSIAALALTVGVSALSYYAFERQFLKLKARWTRVPSRPV